MDLRGYQQGDEFKIIELFELVFKQKMTLEQWNWRFKNNPAGKYMIKLMWEDKKLVGHYAVSPLLIDIDGEDTLTAHSLATMTHPEYGGRGIFKKLSLALYDELENQLGCKAIWGFPNNNSHYGFVKSLGWKDIGIIHTLGCPASSFEKSNSSNKVEKFKEFDQSHVEFIQSKTSEFKIKVKRSMDYLNWRYTQKPSVTYKNFFIENDGHQALFVTKIYPSSQKPSLFDLNIVEGFVDDYDLLPDYIHQILLSYDVKFDRVTTWKNLFDKDHLKLEKIGFVPVLPQTYLGARPHFALDPKFMDLRNWYISMGDSDVF